MMVLPQKIEESGLPSQGGAVEALTNGPGSPYGPCWRDVVTMLIALSKERDRGGDD